MARTAATNYTAAGSNYVKATVDADTFDSGDIQLLAEAVDLHDHTSTRGLPVQRLTTGQVNGDIFYATGAGAIARLAVGTANQGLIVSSGLPAWAASPTSVLTTTGDLLYASAANTLARLAIGTANQMLITSGGLPAWAASPTSVLTTTGDLLYASAANVLARLGVGTARQTIRSTGTLPEWVNGMTEAGSNLVEASTTSTTQVDILSATVSLPVSSYFLVYAVFRRSATAETVSVGLKLNTATVAGPTVATDSNGAARDGVYWAIVGPHDANHPRAGMTGVVSAGTGPTFNYFGVDIPNATITSVVIVGNVTTSATLYVDELRVYALN